MYTKKKDDSSEHFYAVVYVWSRNFDFSIILTKRELGNDSSSSIIKKIEVSINFCEREREREKQFRMGEISGVKLR